MSDHFELMAFGVKIVARDNTRHMERVLVTEPVEGSREAVVEPSQLGNTRHLSAAQFVSDQKDRIALVASQDGRFTVFAWSAAAQLGPCTQARGPAPLEGRLRDRKSVV